MRLNQLAARRGALWVRGAFALFFRQPVAFSVLFVGFMFTILFVGALPLVGHLVVLAALPMGSLVFMAATRVAREGAAPWPAAIGQALRSDRARLIAQARLGVLYALATLGAVSLSQWVDGGALDALMDTLMSGKATPESISERLANPMLGTGIGLRFGLLALLSVPYWHAPALVHWGGQGALQALFSSTLAVWRNRGAYLVYGLAWAAVMALFAVALNLVLLASGATPMLALLATPATLIISTVYYVSLYFTFDDCFTLSPAADPAADEPR
jgi:hypothetical protein